MASLRSAVGDAPIVFVVGKGGVGKSTAAAALALDMADAGSRVHLISTDPAHSLADVLRQPFGSAPVRSACSDRLTVEEFDAEARADAWLRHATGPVSSIVEAGTYLDAEDVAGFTRLALPGLDELMAVLRLVELAASADGAVVVDTPPTGHALRLLDASQTHETLAAALQAMADKAAVVASSFAGRGVRLAGESFIEELESVAAAFRDDVLARASFIVAARPDAMVVAETVRLADALRDRRLRVAAHVWAGGAPAGDASDATSHASAPAPGGATSHFAVPLLDGDVTGCDGLRAWTAAVRPASREAPTDACDAPGPSQVPAGAVRTTGAAGPGRERDLESARAPDPRAWVAAAPWRLIIVAGKGGVGKTTCAAALAVELSGQRDVLLCSTDPAGSLDDVLGVPVTAAGRAAPRLRTLQVDAQTHLAQLREEFRTDIEDALDRIGIGSSATLDRRVMEALWELAPPGIDEFAALAALLDAAAGSETIVLDTAPTGHFLRLLTLPDIALHWTRQLMRIVVKYRATSADGVAGSLLRTARELRTLRDLLRERDSAAVIIVTLREAVVAAETARLRDRLHEAGVHVAATVHNRAAPGAAGAGGDGTAADHGVRIDAPLRPRPPVGADALREFLGTWKIEG